VLRVPLQLLTEIPLPPHTGPGGFDHAAVATGTHTAYLAHTANNALDIIDCESHRYLRSIENLTGVAGAAVSEACGLVMTSNRGEGTVSLIPLRSGAESVKIPVGIRPNGLAFDEGRRLLLAANVGDPEIADSYSVTLVDVEARAVVSRLAVSGRTRWTLFEPSDGKFYVNIADPAQILCIDPASPGRIERVIDVPAPGPHGLELDARRRRLLCACDAERLVAFDLASGVPVADVALSGKPDVIMLDPGLDRAYVAIGDPGLVDVFDLESLRRIGVVPTEKGAHTLAVDPHRHVVLVFLPESCCARVYRVAG
jgi:DNA-binding beta-propeller fold protein YncE